MGVHAIFSRGPSYFTRPCGTELNYEDGIKIQKRSECSHLCELGRRIKENILFDVYGPLAFGHVMEAHSHTNRGFQGDSNQ